MELVKRNGLKEKRYFILVCFPIPLWQNDKITYSILWGSTSSMTSLSFSRGSRSTKSTENKNAEKGIKNRMLINCLYYRFRMKRIPNFCLIFKLYYYHFQFYRLIFFTDMFIVKLQLLLINQTSKKNIKIVIQCSSNLGIQLLYIYI